MALSSQPSGRGHETALPPALSSERIEQALAAEGWTYQIDSDGDIGGMWDNNLFYFFLYGDQNEILQIRGRWHQALPLEHRARVRQALDDYHQVKIWPKAYTRVDDDGRLWVLSEHTVDWEFGVTDEQLALTLRCAITTSLSLYHELGQQFIVAPTNAEDNPKWWF